MKRNLLIGLALLMSSAYITPVMAADDPCEVTLCLWGKLNGASQSECSSAERKFFDIVKKKKGSFRPDKTFNARKKFLNQECPAGNVASKYTDKIMGKFGKVH